MAADADSVRFLLAQLHLKSLTSVKSARVLRARLETLPTGSGAYNMAYVQAMGRIRGQSVDAQALALRILSWISCARRPLTVRGLQHALAVKKDTHETHGDNITNAEDLVSVCAGLVVIGTESQIIRLVHYTTQEFFEREWPTWFPNAQVDITTTCVTYLLYDTFESGFCRSYELFKERLRHNPLYDYTARNWGHHAQTVVPEVGSLLLSLLSTDGWESACSQALQVPGYQYVEYSHHVAKKLTGLHLTAYFGLVQLMVQLLKIGLNPSLRDSRDRTPVSVAAKEEHEGVVQLLVSRVDTVASSEDQDCQTSLSLAAEGGHKLVVKLLVGRDDVNANSKD